MPSPPTNCSRLDEINRELLGSIMAENVKNSSVNRVNEVIRAALRKAYIEWEWIDRVPRIRMLPEPKRRVRWITHEEADRLIAVLPKHLMPAVKCSLGTGLRRSNVTGLLWSQIDLTRRTATPLHVLQELGGWECVEMVRKHAHLSSEHLTEYVDRLSRLKAVENELEEAATFELRKKENGLSISA